MTSRPTIRIRPEQDTDALAIERIHSLAFDQPDEGRLVTALRDSDAFIPTLSLVAERNDELLGHILLTRIRILSEANGGATAALALAPVAVLPNHQRRGVGSALIRHALDEAKRLGHDIVVVLGHADYYPRFGFEPALPLGIRAPFDCPAEAWMVLSLRDGIPRGVRGTVVYPEAFGLEQDSIDK